MKKRTRNILLGLALALILGAAWYFVPTRPISAQAGDVAAITVFDGNTGRGAEITDPAEIAQIMDALNGLKLRRDNISLGRNGYRYRMTLHGPDGKGVPGWDTFILNGADTVRKDPFFYRVAEGDPGLDYLERLLDAQN